MCPLELFRRKEYGQLGLRRFPKTTRGDVPFPVELHLPSVRVVSLAASDKSAQISLLLVSTNALVTYWSCVLTGLFTHLALTVVYMFGVSIFDPFCFALKSLGINDLS